MIDRRALASSRALLLVLSTSACAGAGWQASSRSLADPSVVAAALGDPPPHARAVPADFPHLEPPNHPRTCCAFGMDLGVDFAGMQVPFFEVGNVIDPSQLASHAYTLPMGAPETEGNGLVYTCRAGFVDTSHVRECADNTLFFALRMASTLSTGTTIDFPGHGGDARIEIAPIASAVIERHGAIRVASALAAWIAYRIALWHEISTWYGYQMVAGFSERPSAFSLEDLYSNALGARLAMGVLEERAFRTDEEYDLVMEAFIQEALSLLEARSAETSRAIMAALDGHWWDSTRRLPDNHLVTRRLFPGATAEVTPWRADEAFAPDAIPSVVSSECNGADVRTLRIAERVGGLRIRDLVSITVMPEDWADASFPYADPSEHVVHDEDFERLVTLVHTELESELGAGFDAPR